MAFNIITTPIDHTSDAGFRAWAQELDAAFIAAGWVNTADTGQVNLSTMTRPGTNTMAGYRVYYLNDSLHATAPIYMRVDYRTGGTATYPQWSPVLGQGTNGAGVLTGLTSTPTSPVQSIDPSSTVANYSTYVSWGDGYFAIAWKAGATTNGYGFFAVNRFTDSLGTPKADGYAVYYRVIGTTPTALQQCISYLANTVYEQTTSYSMVGGNVSTSLVAGVAQVYRNYVITPRMQLNPFMLCVVKSELPTGTVFQADVVGTGLRNWMSVSQVTGAATVGASANYGFAIPWY